MITEQTELLPRIEWEITAEILEQDPEERFISYNAIGKGDDGKTYSGSAEYVCDELEGIKDIEEI